MGSLLLLGGTVMALLVLDDEELFATMEAREIEEALPQEEMACTLDIFPDEDTTKEYLIPAEWHKLVDKLAQESENGLDQPASKRVGES
jgi:hypothetical protein